VVLLRIAYCRPESNAYHSTQDCIKFSFAPDTASDEQKLPDLVECAVTQDFLVLLLWFGAWSTFCLRVWCSQLSNIRCFVLKKEKGSRITGVEKREKAEESDFGL
jgi:hypothetical protein